MPVRLMSALHAFHWTAGADVADGPEDGDTLAPSQLAPMDALCTLHTGGQVDLTAVAPGAVEYIHSVLSAPVYLGGQAALRKARRVVRDAIADAYRSAWSRPAAKQLLSHGAHLMVGNALDLPDVGIPYSRILHTVRASSAHVAKSGSVTDPDTIHVAYNDDDLDSELEEEYISDEEKDGGFGLSPSAGWKPSARHKVDDGMPEHLIRPLDNDFLTDDFLAYAKDGEGASMQFPDAKGPRPGTSATRPGTGGAAPLGKQASFSAGAAEVFGATPANAGAGGGEDEDDETKGEADKVDEGDDSSEYLHPSVLEDFCLPFGFGLLMCMNRHRKAKRAAKLAEQRKLEADRAAKARRLANSRRLKSQRAMNNAVSADPPKPGSPASVRQGVAGPAAPEPEPEEDKDPGPVGVGLGMTKAYSSFSMSRPKIKAPSAKNVLVDVSAAGVGTAHAPPIVAVIEEDVDLWEQAQTIVAHLIFKV